MNVSAKADYGMRALCELAAAHRVDPAKLVKGDQIATAQQIPIKFLEGILRLKSRLPTSFAHLMAPWQPSEACVLRILSIPVPPSTFVRSGLPCAHQCGMCSRTSVLMT
jgi:hypothetical protein